MKLPLEIEIPEETIGWFIKMGKTREETETFLKNIIIQNMETVLKMLPETFFAVESGIINIQEAKNYLEKELTEKKSNE